VRRQKRELFVRRGVRLYGMRRPGVVQQQQHQRGSQPQKGHHKNNLVQLRAVAQISICSR